MGFGVGVICGEVVHIALPLPVPPWSPCVVSCSPACPLPIPPQVSKYPSCHNLHDFWELFYSFVSAVHLPLPQGLSTHPYLWNTLPFPHPSVLPQGPLPQGNLSRHLCTHHFYSGSGSIFKDYQNLLFFKIFLSLGCQAITNMVWWLSYLFFLNSKLCSAYCPFPHGHLAILADVQPGTHFLAIGRSMVSTLP